MSFAIKNDFRYLGLIATVYLTITFLLSSLKPLWFDEFFAFHIGQFSPEKLFDSLGPMDPHPPLHNLIIGLSQSFFGTTKFATRLPSILYCLGTLITLYFICKRLGGTLTARLSSLLLLVSFAQQYAYEARPYSLVIVLTALLVYFWLKTPTGKLQTYILITITTMALLSSHFYAVFIPAILLLSSFIEWLRTKKLDSKLWLSIAMGYLILFLYLPAIQKIKILDNNNWASPSFYGLIHTIRNLYAPFVIALIPALLNWQNWQQGFKAFTKLESQFTIGLTALAVLALIGYPLSFLLGAYHVRYFIGSLIPCVIISAIILSNYSKKQLYTSLGLVFVLLSYKLVHQTSIHLQKKDEINSVISLLNKREIGYPVFISNPFWFFIVLQEASDVEKKDLQYLINLNEHDELQYFEAADVSTYELSKLSSEITVKNIHFLDEIDDKFYYLFCGNPFSYQLKDLENIRKFKTVQEQGNNHLLISVQ